MCAAPTTVLNYRHVYKIGAPADTGTAWNLELDMLPSPLVFARYLANGGGANVVGNWVNPTYGANIDVAGEAFRASVTRWRMCYYGVSVYLDAPALSNQGTLVATQFEFPGRQISGATGVGAGGVIDVPGYKLVGYPRIFPSYSTLEQMPNSYFGQAKDGVYIPFKLDDNHVAWREDSDRCFDVTSWFALSDGWSGVNVPVAAPAATGPYPAATQQDRKSVV